MSFRGVFIAVFLGTAMIVAAFLISRARPREETAQPTAALVRATGKCAECHRRETSAVVHEYEMSRHAAKSASTASTATSRRGAGAARPPGLHHREEADGGQLHGSATRPSTSSSCEAGTPPRPGRR